MTLFFVGIKFFVSSQREIEIFAFHCTCVLIGSFLSLTMLSRVAVTRVAARSIALRALVVHASNSSLLTATSSSFARRPIAVSTFRFKSTAAEAPAATEATSKQEESHFVSSADRKYEFFHNVEITGSGVAIIRFDCPKAVNTISFKLADEAKAMWKNDIMNNDSIKAIVFTSAKPNMFIGTY